MENMELDELLWELGYDKREDLFEENEKMRSFMKQVDREIRLEAKRYIDELYDNSLDEYDNFKDVAQTYYYRKPFDPRTDSIIINK